METALLLVAADPAAGPAVGPGFSALDGAATAAAAAPAPAASSTAAALSFATPDFLLGAPRPAAQLGAQLLPVTRGRPALPAGRPLWSPMGAQQAAARPQSSVGKTLRPGSTSSAGKWR